MTSGWSLDGRLLLAVLVGLLLAGQGVIPRPLAGDAVVDSGAVGSTSGALPSAGRDVGAGAGVASGPPSTAFDPGGDIADADSDGASDRLERRRGTDPSVGFGTTGAGG